MIEYDEEGSYNRSHKFHVRALSSGNVHPLVLHSGVFDMGLSISDDLAETPVVCCDHLAAVVREQAWSHSTPIVKGTLIVWNWRTGNQVAVLVSPPSLDILSHGPHSPVMTFAATIFCTNRP